MKVTKSDVNEVVIDYGRGVAVRYKFNSNNSRVSISRKHPRIMTVAEENIEQDLAREGLKLPLGTVEISKLSPKVIQMQEVTADNVSVLTKFNFASKVVSKVSQDNYVGEDRINPDLNFIDFNLNSHDKIRLEIAEKALKLLR